MKDSICLIPPEHFLSDKSYSNVVEFAFRTKIISDYLRLSGAESRASDGVGSDYDILVSLVDSFRKNSDSSSRIYRYFSRVLLECFNIDAKRVINREISVDELWKTTSDALMKRENTLWGIISRSELCEICVAAPPFDLYELPENIGNVSIKSAVCPLGVNGEGILDTTKTDSFESLRLSIDSAVKRAEKCAVLLCELDFEFAVPNLYTSSIAYDKIKRGLSLRDNEKMMLRTQLLRDVITSCAEHEKELMLVLSDASNVKGMYQTEQLLGYMDDCLQKPISIVMFACDVVGFSFAISHESKRYKKITVEAAIGGNDRYLMTDDAKYFGVGALPERMASLSDTPAYLGKIIC